MGRKNIVPIVFAILILITGCRNENQSTSQKDHPTTIKIWHYYNGAQQDEFNKLIEKFNKTTGEEKGIVVQGTSHGTIADLEKNILDSVHGKAGAEEIPNIFAAYGDTAYKLDQLGYVVDLSQYFTKKELSKYIDSYIEEGRFSGKNTLKIFPVAKSIEVMVLNWTDWSKFSKATGVTTEDLSTVEGVTETAKKYYEWTDGQTKTPNDGKAFFGRDAFANYMLAGSKQLGKDIFRREGKKMIVDFDQKIAKKLWDNYYVPYVKGYFSSAGKFRSDDMKIGNILACVSSSSSVTYFPKQVMVDDNKSYPIKRRVFEAPKFKDGKNYQVQQGAGMLILKSNKKEQQASAEFLKWFTKNQQNISFSTASGYLPVTKSANNMKEIEKVRKVDGLVKQTLKASFQTISQNYMYTQPPFQNGLSARNVLETTMVDWAKKDRKIVQKNLESGMTLEQAARQFCTDEYFEKWYEDTKSQLKMLAK